MKIRQKLHIMKQSIILKILLSVFILAGGSLQAQRHHQHKADRRVAVRQKKKARAIRRYNRNKVVVVKKRRGRVLTVVPKGAVIYSHKNIAYHYHAGKFYRPHSNRFAMVIPPRGIRVRTLPSKAYRFNWRGKPYFYFSGVFYVQSGQEYETAEVEEGMRVPILPEYLVEEVQIDNKDYYAVDNVLYRSVEEDYEVVGELSD